MNPPGSVRSNGGARVVLVGGTPGAGKTTLARALAAELGFGSLPGDALYAAAKALTDDATHPALHEARKKGHVRYFTEGPPEKLVSDAAALEEEIWPAFEAVIASHLVSGDGVVIDWWLFSPESVAAYDDDRVASLWITIDDAVLEARERSIVGWTDGSSDPERMLSNFLHRSRWRNWLVASQAAELGLGVIHVDGSESVPDLTERALGLLRE
jgi:2-phosphoglycerate kinase